MSNNRRYGEQRSRINKYSYVFIGIFVLLAAWLITSLVKKENPFSLLSNIFTFDKKSELPEEDSSSTIELKNLIKSQQNIIDSLKNRLDIIEGVDNFIRAKVVVESTHLNMRKSPSLSASMVTKISNGEEVHVVEYDDQSYILDGKSGKWCKIVSRGQTGWVWGNYIELLEE